MQSIGILSVILFLASLAAFMMAFYNIEMVRTGTILGFVLLLAASALLAVTIKRRNKTERI